MYLDDFVIREVSLAEKAGVSTREIHVDEELLDDYLLNRCDAFTAAAVAHHLRACVDCRAWWMKLSELRAWSVCKPRP